MERAISNDSTFFCVPTFYINLLLLESRGTNNIIRMIEALMGMFFSLIALIFKGIFWCIGALLSWIWELITGR